MKQNLVSLKFIPLTPQLNETIAHLQLNREDASNALSGEVGKQITEACREIDSRGPSVRAVVVSGKGKHFCAGADFKWMAQARELSDSDNHNESQLFHDVFQAVSTLRAPTIAAVQGAAFGGGVGLAAACDWVVAESDARFCLSEVRRGFSAAVILSHLIRKVDQGQLRRWVLTAKLVSAEEALAAGLIERVCAPGELEKAVKEELALVLAGDSGAQAIFKDHHRSYLAGKGLDELSWRENVVSALARSRKGEAGKEGVSAFYEKRNPAWTREVPSTFTLF